jgi:hypothetical protein
MTIPLALIFACLPWAVLNAQDPSPSDENGKSSKRVIRVLIAGQRAMPAFKKEGDQYVEREPPAKWVMPTALELIGAVNATPGTPGEKQEAIKPIWPNDVANLGIFKCASPLRLRLMRTINNQPNTPLEVSCELGKMIEPLIVISADSGGKGWDQPQTRVIDISSQNVPSRSVLALNLTRVPLSTRFESELKRLDPSSVSMLRLPATETGVFRFRIDAQSKNGVMPVANSSYQIGAKDRLILLAVPNDQVAPGQAPLSLQMVLFGVDS